MSKACLPYMPLNANKFSSEDYKTWCTNIHGGYFEENIASLINVKPSKVSLKNKEHDKGDGPLGGNAQNPTYVSITSSRDRRDAQAIEPLVANKRKDALPSLEENGSSNVDLRRDSKRTPSLRRQETSMLVMLQVIHYKQRTSLKRSFSNFSIFFL
ncbi:hypothetical protein Pfo_001980 [Paulownia fortunei]|nr:hypothetical protein Pfo_001980 [Paulownia fortunei]